MGRGLQYATCFLTLGLLAYLAVGALAGAYIAVTSECAVCGAYGGFLWPLWLAGLWAPPG